jgi:hypothetical protein
MATAAFKDKVVIITGSLSAMSNRKRELVMPLRGKLGQWLKLIAPRLVDRIASQAIKSGH